MGTLWWRGEVWVILLLMCHWNVEVESVLGYLIYEKDEAKKNRAFIELFEKEGMKQGITFRYVEQGEIGNVPLPDFVLNRTRNAQVSRWFEERSVKTFHNEILTALGNHKYNTLCYLQKKLPKDILETDWAPASIYITAKQLEKGMGVCASREYFAEVTREKEANLFQKDLSLEKDWIMKSVDGHGGNEVCLLKSDVSQECLNRQLMFFRRKDCIIQERIPSNSKDLRVYIVGGEIYAAMIRCGTVDFRSNYSLGGTAKEYVLSKEEREYVEGYISCFPKNTLGMVGMDFIVTREGRLVFNELEEMVGSRMLYQYTGHNIVKDYVTWLSKVNLL